MNPARWPLRRRLVLSLAGMFLLGYTVLSVAGYYFARAWTVPGDSCLLGIYRCEGTYWTWRTRVIVTGLIVTGLAVIAWISWFLTGQLLRPLRAAAEAVRRVGPQNLGQRVAMTGAPDELRRLTDALDEALDRIAAGYEGQRRFAANASHELRTPLATVRAAGSRSPWPGSLRSPCATPARASPRKWCPRFSSRSAGWPPTGSTIAGEAGSACRSYAPSPPRTTARSRRGPVPTAA